jgi:hypothetical protein
MVGNGRGTQANTTTRKATIGWRTWPNVHPELPGILLNVRHRGYGWLGFLLPYKEAQGLGTWLVEHARSED